MKTFTRKMFALATVPAMLAALASCQGSDSKSETTTKPTHAATTVAITSPATTTPATTPPTVKATTTTEAVDLTYEIVVGEYDSDGYFIADIPDDGTYPLDAANPNGGLTFREIMELDAASEVCFYGTEQGDVTVTVDKTGIISLQDLFTYLAIHVKTADGQIKWLPAPDSGVITSPVGTWVKGPHVALGPCQ